MFLKVVASETEKFRFHWKGSAKQHPFSLRLTYEVLHHSYANHSHCDLKTSRQANSFNFKPTLSKAVSREFTLGWSDFKPIVLLNLVIASGPEKFRFSKRGPSSNTTLIKSLTHYTRTVYCMMAVIAIRSLNWNIALWISRKKSCNHTDQITK